MPFCPHCNTEYRAGFTTCSDCGSTLVEQPAAPAQQPEAPRGYREPVLLASLTDTNEADRLEALLESAGVPVTRKYEGAGQYLSIVGALPYLGVDLYVPADCREEAAELLAAFGGQSVPADRAEPEFETEPEIPAPAGSRRSAAWLLLILFAAGTVISGVVLLIRFIITLLYMF